ncbi:LOB domain-containing protein 13-like [Camellia sinensis]|uniref:LOB domain-containing protein 13-like n=1 Tax=Camellia sinensis TaxID=4442 RepID=UPI001035B79B|nr:LOB domain-containing protein 13-like [Camellia sinensis]
MSSSTKANSFLSTSPTASLWSAPYFSPPSVPPPTPPPLPLATSPPIPPPTATFSDPTPSPKTMNSNAPTPPSTTITRSKSPSAYLSRFSSVFRKSRDSDDNPSRSFIKRISVTAKDDDGLCGQYGREESVHHISEVYPGEAEFVAFCLRRRHGDSHLEE